MKALRVFIAIMFLALMGVASQDAQAQNISYPFGDVDYIASTADSLTLDITVNEQVTYVDVAATTLDTVLTINATLNSELRRGALLYIETTADGTNRAVTFGDNLTNTALTNTASKTFVTTFLYDGTIFKAIAEIQID